MIGRSHQDGELIPRSPNYGPGDLRSGGMYPVVGRQASGAKDEQSAGRSIVAVIAAVRRRWLLALFLGLTFGVSGGVAAWVFIPAKYTAFAEMRISSVQGRILFKTAEERADFETWKQTQIKLVKNPVMLSKAIRKPEVANLRTVRAQVNPVEWLERNLVVTSAGTEFFRISLAGEYPQDLQEILSSVVKAYDEEVISGEAKERQVRLSKLEQVLRDNEEKLRIKRESLKKLTDQMQVSNTEQANQRQRYLLELAIQMRKELAEVHMQLMNAKLEAETSMPAEEGAEGAEAPSGTELIPDAVVEALAAEEPEYVAQTAKNKQLESYINQLVSRVPQNHPTVMRAREQLTAGEKVAAELKTTLQSKVRERLIHENALEVAKSKVSTNLASRRHIAYLEARKKKLDEELDSVKSDETRAGIGSLDLDTLSKEISRTQEIVDAISNEAERARVEIESPIGITIYRKPDVPQYRDQKQRIAGSAIVGGGLFVFFAGGILWLEMMSKRISMMNEVVDDLSLRVLGTVPMLPRFVTARRSSRPHARATYWQNVLTESIDATRTMLLRNAQSGGMNCVMIASALEGEGKTTLACHLATSMARAGRSVVLVDCDLRRPSVQKVFGLPSSAGLSEVLKGEMDLAAAIQPAGAPGLSVIAAGQFCPHTLQNLARDGMERILGQLRTQFDFVIVDSSPILPVTDALLVAQHVDGVVFAIRRDVSRLAKVSAACQRLSMLGIPFLGAVVIGLDEGTYGSRYPYSEGYPYNSTAVVHANEAVTAS